MFKKIIAGLKEWFFGIEVMKIPKRPGLSKSKEKVINNIINQFVNKAMDFITNEKYSHKERLLLLELNEVITNAEISMVMATPENKDMMSGGEIVKPFTGGQLVLNNEPDLDRIIFQAGIIKTEIKLDPEIIAKTVQEKLN